jgi:hypothetical protein
MLPQWLVILLLIVILVLDVSIAISVVVISALFVMFHAGKLAHDLVNRTIDRLVYSVLCFLEDLLESPPMDRAPILGWALIGVKLAYDMINAFQNMIERIVVILVTLLAAAIGIAAIGVLFAINASALWLVWSYHLL